MENSEELVRNRILRTTGVVLLAVGIAAAIGALVLKDQIERHKRDLFSPHALKRLAALGYIGGLDPNIDLIQVLRDFVAREPKRLLRSRASHILVRMERSLGENGGLSGGYAG